MKILLDHNVPHELRGHFPDEHEVYTASYLGWSGYSDSEILSEAVKEGFEVFVTLDTNLPEQQALSEQEIGVIVLAIHPTTPEYLEGIMPLVEKSLRDTAEENRITILKGQTGGSGPHPN